MPENKTITSDAKQLVSLILIKFKTMSLVKGGSRGRVQGVRIPPPPEMTCGFIIQLVFCKKETMWFIGVEVEQETSAPPPKKKSWIRPC